MRPESRPDRCGTACSSSERSVQVKRRYGTYTHASLERPPLSPRQHAPTHHSHILAAACEGGVRHVDGLVAQPRRRHGAQQKREREQVAPVEVVPARPPAITRACQARRARTTRTSWAMRRPVCDPSTERHALRQLQPLPAAGRRPLGVEARGTPTRTKQPARGRRGLHRPLSWQTMAFRE